MNRVFYVVCLSLIGAVCWLTGVRKRLSVVLYYAAAILWKRAALSMQEFFLKEQLRVGSQAADDSLTLTRLVAWVTTGTQSSLIGSLSVV